MPRVQEDPEEGIAEMLVDDGLERPARLTDAQRAVPRGDRREIRRDQAIDVVADLVPELARILHDEARPAGQRPPDAERRGERVAALDGPIAGAQQPVSRARP